MSRERRGERVGAFNGDMESCDTRVVRDGSRPAMVIVYELVSLTIFLRDLD